MSFDFVDMPSLGVRIPASFKRMAELRSIHRDATSVDLDIQQAVFALCRALVPDPLFGYCFNHKIAYFIS